MGLFSKIFGKKNDDKNTGGMEDYMKLLMSVSPTLRLCPTSECSKPRFEFLQLTTSLE